MYATLYLFADEGAQQSNNGPEENATAQDDLSVEAVAQVTEDGSRHHEAADEDCERRKGENVTLDTLAENGCSASYYRVTLVHFAAVILEIPTGPAMYFSFPVHLLSQDLSRPTGW